MNINSFLFNSIINAKAKHLGRNHQFIYCQLPDGKIIKAYALTHVSSVNVSVVKFEGNYYCFCGSAPIELSRSTKQLGVRVKRQIKEQSLLFLLIDITKSLENDGVLQAINYINTHNYQFYQYLSFGDTTGYISEPLNKTNILTELQDYYDNYNPDYDDDFYCSEGTDLPENGIDALNDAILSIDNKYLVDLYLVTDNSKYSRNTSEPEDILNLIDEKINKLFIDIIQPKNIPSEHIVIEGFENNPYCNNSAITQVLVNDEIIGNYPKNSNILIQNRLKLVWDGGQRTITNPNNYKVWVSPVSTPDIVYVEVNCSYEINDGVRITTVSSWDLQLKTSVQLEFLNYFKPPDYHVTVLENTSSYYKLQSNSSGENLQLLSAYDLYKYGTLISERQYILVRPSVYINNGDIIEIWINSVRVVFPLNNNRWNVVIRDGDYLYETYPINGINGIYSRDIIPDNSSPNRKIISTSMISNELSKQLKINGNIVQSLQETDIVKVICQPQNVPLIETNSTLYTTSLPPSNKIIYLD